MHVAVNMVKCAVGAGSFGVPSAFKGEGLWGGVVGTIILGMLSAHTIVLLANAEKHLVRTRGSLRRYTYPEVARLMFPKVAIGGVNLVEVLVYFGMCLSSIGVCSVYAVFIIQTFPAVFHQVKQWYVEAAIGPMMLGLALVRSYKYLAITSILGDVAVTCGIVASVAYGLEQHTPTFHLPAFHLSGIPQASSTLAFLFLIHAIVLPMAQSMDGDLASPHKFERIAWWGHGFITFLNLLFGLLCYMAFKEQTEGNVIDNLGHGIVLQIVKVLLCVDLLFTVPMVLAFGREIIEKSLFALSFTQKLVIKYDMATRILIRIFLIALIMGTSIGLIHGTGGNAFNNLINLVGGAISFILGFVLPPLFHLRVLQETKQLRFHSVLINGFICLIGLTLMFSSSYFTIKDMIHS